MAHSPVAVLNFEEDGHARPSGTAGAERIRRARLQDGWRRAKRGWPARFPVAQAPNAPLVIAMSGWLAAEVTHGSPQAYARGVFYVALSAWAWEELTGGASWFRRGLGAAALTYLVVEVASAVSQS